LDEELHIFPSLLEKNDEQLSSIVQKLKLDHNWIEQTWSDLSPHLEAMVEGFSWFDPDLVLHGLEIMQSQYADHMALEELTAYPEARKAIGEKEAEEMIKEILERRH
jgi:hemerythrin-like domain-containing protein